MQDQVAAALLAARTSGWTTFLPNRESISTIFGKLRMSSWWATRSSSRRYGFPCSDSFHARAEGRAIPAKGLTGTGYDGHSFWRHRPLRCSGAGLHRSSGCRGRLALASFYAPHGKSSRARPRTERGRFPVANDTWRRMLGLLARRNCGVSHQCGYFRVGSSVCESE